MANSPLLKTNNMKLYTEEQVRDILSGFIGKRNADDYLNRYYTPIELPSDEEIEELMNKNGYHDKEYDDIWREGAKWMRDKILNK